ncbi:HPP family protein [Caenimonas terrae]|uniref:HPP family protein n=1 Tax=Caenimonas terrae TaxID=696074 RepID=A0ABW0NIL0_9BURK
MEVQAVPSRSQQLLVPFRAFFAALWPAPVHVDARQRLRALVGGLVGVALAGLLTRWLAGAGGFSTWLVAPIGASAVLVFAVPASPLAQPWAVVGGNTVSALVGIACVLAIPDPAIAGAVAVGLAIALMFQLRCLHPPGGAAALLVVLTHTDRFQFAAFPVMLNSLLLVLGGMAYNSLTGRPYPHPQSAPAPAPGGAQPASRFSAADLDTALAHYNQVVDISRDDLEALLHDAESAAYARNLGQLRCADVMSPDPVSVQFGTPLAQAWELMRTRKIKALPVTDRAKRIAGIVTVADFMTGVGLDQHEGIGERLRALLRVSGTTHSDRPEVVGQIMTRKVQVASADRFLLELVPLFSEKGHHHIPIIDGEQRLVGIITQSDLVRSLYRAVQPVA